jgi:2-amino-4-hydroxy-6-hydroxymethyldihydropteridine diphosphokinase
MNLANKRQAEYPYIWPMNIVYLILGGNIGNIQENLEKTRALIDKAIGAITKKSAIFITEPWGNTDQPDFYNQAIELYTSLEPSVLLTELLNIEKAAGRVRGEEKWAARTMDIDILFYDQQIIHEHHLKIPHPYMQERRFVLAPLAEIAPEFKHPVLKKSILQLLEECPDHSAIRKLESTH